MNRAQLEHVLVNACVMTDADLIEARDLTLLGAWEHDEDAAERDDAGAEEEREDDGVAWDHRVTPSGAPPSNEEEWKAQEKRKILEALEGASWNRVRAAKVLGMPRRTFYRRLKEYGILD